MQNKKNVVNFRMRISSIDIMRFSQEDFSAEEQTQFEAVDHETSFLIRIFEDSQEVGIETSTRLKLHKIDKTVGELQVLMKFNIDPFDSVITKSRGERELPDMLVSNLFSITAGTVRGILYERLRGTKLQNDIFPLIDVGQILESGRSAKRNNSD